jgi:beta-1,4-mannooligosaccharide/beta-1,4-mannosyl-N-acetylglucosamine phosphorylase
MIKTLESVKTEIPWEERPAECKDVVWRYSKNPVIQRNAIPSSNSIFNSAVVAFKDGVAGIFRCDDKSRCPMLHAGFSPDGINWKINHSPISFIDSPDDIATMEYAYDPRVCWIEDRYYITWCNGYQDLPTIGIAYTFDFKEFHQLENAFLPFNRNGVMFPRKINGEYIMLSRPSDAGHTPFGDIFLSHSKDMTYWGKHRLVIKSGRSYWQSCKIGAGPIPIETPEGWLMLYHGVLKSCNGYVYSMGAALLDLEKPWKIIASSRNYLLSPQTSYECVGDVNNVVFPCASVTDSSKERIAIYYGCADTVTGLAFGYIDEIIDYIKENPA